MQYGMSFVYITGTQIIMSDTDRGEDYAFLPYWFDGLNLFYFAYRKTKNENNLTAHLQRTFGNKYSIVIGLT